MFGKFLPQKTIFFDFFEQHAKLTQQAAQLLQQWMLSDQITTQEEIYPIKSLEHQADKLTSNCIDTLHKSFITPLQQNDIFRLISRMDDVIDCIDEIFDHCLIYKIASFTPAAKEMSQLLVVATDKLEFIVKGLRDRKKYSLKIRETNRQIHQLEDQADKILRHALGQLFDEEQDLRLLIKWKEIYEGLERAMDYCDDVSDIIEGIIVEYD
jgi:uncharacterized protein Yka (UPF0111/DUF47 family)